MTFNFASRHIFGSSLWGMLGAPHKIKDMIIISQEKGQTLDGNKIQQKEGQTLFDIIIK